MREAIASGLLVLLLALRAGAQDELTTIDVQPDGRGSIKLDVFEDRRTSERLLASARTPEARERMAVELAVERLASWRGVVAWTGVQGGLHEGCLRFRGTAWFEDLGRLQRVTPDGVVVQSFVVTRASDALAVTVVDEHVDEVPGLGDDESLLDRGAQGVRVMRGVMRTMLQDTLAQLKRERVLVMPAAITSHSGFTEAAGRRASHRVDGKLLLAHLDAVLEKAEGLADQVERGDLTVEAARAQLDVGVESPRLVVESGLPPDVDAVNDAFTTTIEGAKGAWRGSVWRERLERRLARPRPREEDLPTDPEPPAREPEPPPPPPARRDPPPRPAEPERPTRRVTAAAFEPNDDPAHATPLEPGRVRGMALHGEDWYRVEVPPATAVRVEALFDARAVDLDLELVAEGGAVLARATGLAGRERLRAVPLAPGPCFVRVAPAEGWAAERPPVYRLDLDLLPLSQADRLEPNDPPHPPAAIEPGKHEGLLCDGEDRYALSAGAGARVEVTLTWSEGDGDVDLELQDAQGRVLGAARGGGAGAGPDQAEGARANAACLAPVGGQVLVRVTGDDGTAYAMTVQVTKGPAPDALEPNDAPAAARPLEPGSYPDLLLEGDDWYRVSVPAGKTLRVTASFTHAEGDLDLALHREDGALLRVSAGQGNEERVEHSAAGAAQVLVRAHGTGGANRYRLAVALVPFAPADRHEPNESREAARDLAPGEHADLVCTVEDWYRVALKKGQRLRAAIALDPAKGDLDLELVGPDGKTLAASTTLSEREEAAWTAAADGPVFVRVYRNEAPYRLSLVIDP